MEVKAIGGYETKVLGSKSAALAPCGFEHAAGMWCAACERVAERRAATGPAPAESAAAPDPGALADAVTRARELQAQGYGRLPDVSGPCAKCFAPGDPSTGYCRHQPSAGELAHRAAVDDDLELQAAQHRRDPVPGSWAPIVSVAAEVERGRWLAERSQ
jgi:hypothetical protein